MKVKKWQKEKQEAIEKQREEEANEDIEYYELLVRQGMSLSKAWEMTINRMYN